MNCFIQRTLKLEPDVYTIFKNKDPSKMKMKKQNESQMKGLNGNFFHSYETGGGDQSTHVMQGQGLGG